MPFAELPPSVLRPEPTLNYGLWTPGTIVQFANVPWGADYRDVVEFESSAARDSYITNQNGPRLENNTYHIVGNPIDLDISFTTAQNYNYVRVFNPNIGNPNVGSRAYYYFIMDSTFISGNNTRLQVQLDVWQTYGDNVVFGNAFIEQGHVGIADNDNFAEYGRARLTVPEGLDVGGEYVIKQIYSRNLGSARVENALGYSILVQSTIDLTADLGTFEDPKLVGADGNQSENLPNGTETYLFGTLNSFKQFMDVFKDKPHALQGIVSITAIPIAEYNVPMEIVNMPGVNAMWRLTAGALTTKKTEMFENWRNSIGIPGRYNYLNKFKTYPYTVVELTAYTGTPLLIKPESWQDPDGSVLEIPHYASTSARIMFAPYQYNAGSEPVDVDAFGIKRDGGEFLDMATGIFNFPTFMIANDAAKLYLANNKNSIAFQNRSADWSQTRATSGNQLAYDQATANINTGTESTRIGVNAASAGVNVANDAAVMGVGINAVSSGLGGVSGGPLGIGAGLAGAAMNGLRTANEMNARNQQLGVSTGAMNAQNANSAGNAGYIRDSNKAYADSVTKGDYQNTIAGIQAKIQDAMLTQPSTVGQVGGESFMLARYQWGYDMIVKFLDPAAMVAVGEYWLRYGYRVNRFARIPASFRVMTYFSYWKLKETYIVASNCPEMFKQAIRGIFEKGVTVWVNPDDIGQRDNGDNPPIYGDYL